MNGITDKENDFSVKKCTLGPVLGAKTRISLHMSSLYT